MVSEENQNQYGNYCFIVSRDVAGQSKIHINSGHGPYSYYESKLKLYKSRPENNVLFNRFGLSDEQDTLAINGVTELNGKLTIENRDKLRSLIGKLK